VVTINHRLNAFGYTNLSHLDPINFGDAANAGNLDIVAALEWVSDNIAVFGGDPGSVIVFGQSGGGSKIMILLAMPKAKGLFHRAISMSGAAGLNVDPAADMEPYANAFVKELGVDPKNLAVIQQIPMQTVLDARNRAVASSFEGARPVIDGKHIVTRPMAPEGLAMHASVPLLLGSTKTEASLFFQSDMRNFKLTEEQMRSRMRSVFKINDSKIDTIMASYRKDAPDMTSSEILVAVASDVQFRRPLTAAAEMKSGAGWPGTSLHVQLHLDDSLGGRRARFTARSRYPLRLRHGERGRRDDRTGRSCNGSGDEHDVGVRELRADRQSQQHPYAGMEALRRYHTGLDADRQPLRSGQRLAWRSTPRHCRSQDRPVQPRSPL
jgi:carboxylesterase type B